LKACSDHRHPAVVALSKIDFELLNWQFETGCNAIETQKLRRQIAARTGPMAQSNKTRLSQEWGHVLWSITV
jgi:hypothetical protein